MLPAEDVQGARSLWFNLESLQVGTPNATKSRIACGLRSWIGGMEAGEHKVDGEMNDTHIRCS